MSLVTLIEGDLSAAISREGQLVSLQRKGHEYMHGAGKPLELQEDRDKRGWDKSELIMFPIVGKPKNNVVSMGGHTYSMDQHGISRAIPFTLEAVTTSSALIRQSHHQEKVANPKYRHDSPHPEELEWPAYAVEKSIQLSPGQVNVEITVHNLTKVRMGYRLGWHPAFRLQGANDNAMFTIFGKSTYARSIPLADVIGQSRSGAYLLPNVNSVRYVDKATNHGVQLVFEGFNNAMLWTKSEDSGMFCIEPVTQLPDHDGEYLDKVEHQSLMGFEREQYRVEITLF